MKKQNESSRSHMADSNHWLGSLWVPWLVGVSITIVTLVVWQELVIQDRVKVNRLLATHAGNIQRAIQRDFEIRIPELQRMADRWVMKGGTPKLEWEADAKNFLKDIPGFQALEWVDSNLVVRWIVPFEGNEDAKDLLLTFEGRRKMALDASLKSRDVMVTQPIDLVQGQKGFLIFFPLFIENRFDGFILGVFRIEGWINDMMKEFLFSGWGATIFVEGEEVYTSQPYSQRLALERVIDREFSVQNRLWKVRVWPSGSLLAETTSPLPTATMILGLFLAGLIGTTIRIAQTARWRLKTVEVSNQKLGEEVSAKEKAFEALRESEAKMQAVLDGSSSVIYVKNLDGRYLLVNRSFEMLVTRTRDEIYGSTDYDIFPPEIAAEFQLNDRKVLETRKPHSIEETAPHPDGPHIYISNKFPFFNEAGEPYAICGISTDITERKRGEEALKENSRLVVFDVTISNILAQREELNDMLHGCTETIVSHLGAAFARIWTRNENEDMLELQASSGLYTHLDGLHSKIPVGQFKIGMIASERKPHLTNTVIGDSGVPEQEWAKREGMVAFAGYPILFQGRVIGVLAMFARHPLTEFSLKMLESVAAKIGPGIERMRTEKDLTKQRAFLRQVIDSNPNFIFTKNRWGQFTLVNQAVAEAYGTTVEELTGKTVNDFPVNKEEVEFAHAKDLEVLKSGEEQFTSEEVFTDVWGKVRWLQVVKRPLINEKGLADQVLGVATDFTARRQAEQKLRVLVEGTASVTSTDFFRSLVSCLATELHVSCAFVAEIIQETKTRVRTLVFLKDGEFVSNIEYELERTPCREVINGSVVYHPHDVQAAFPQDQDLKTLNAHCYFGIPLLSSSGEVIGHLVLLNDTTVEFDSQTESMVKIFAARAGVELERHRAEQVLFEMNVALSNAMQGIARLDKEGLYLYVNTMYAQMLGYDSDEMIGTSWELTVHPDDLHKAHSAYEKVVQTGKGEFEARGIRKDGSILYKQVLMVKETSANKQQVGHHCFMSDISERKRQEGLMQAIKEAESEYLTKTDAPKIFHALLSHILSLMDSDYGFIGEVLKTSDGTLYLKTHAIANIGSNQERQDLYDRVAPNVECNNPQNLLRQVVLTGNPVISNDPGHVSRFDALVPNGHPPLNTFLGLPFFHGEQVIGMVGIANRRDGYDQTLISFLQPFLTTCGTLITAYQNENHRVKTEEALQKSEHDLRAALNERTRISQDLHDHILQSLYAVGLLVSAAKNSSSEDRHTEVVTYIDQGISQLNQAIQEIRNFIGSLRPDSGTQIHLKEELTMLVRSMKLSNSTKFKLLVEPFTEKLLTKDQKAHILNIAREALRNACQHAQATSGLIRLTRREQEVFFEVKDNGKGFDVKAQNCKGFGLRNIETRAQAIGGILSVKSSPNQGTHIFVTISQNEEIASGR